jgi:catechol 2,3-dioxygenase-like lactoylglutathione lyase family enzyme
MGRPHQDETAFGPCSELKISETILKTGRLDEMKSWYTTVLGVGPFFEHAPAAQQAVGDFGGQTRASDLRMCFFRLSLNYPQTQMIGLFQEPGTGSEVPKGAPGLHHMQLMVAEFEAFILKYEALKAAGLRPHRSANHGPMTSFYYRDPDGNNVEITCQNFPSLQTMIEFMASDVFKRNPSGEEIDPEAFVARYRAGETVAQLTRLG